MVRTMPSLQNWDIIPGWLSFHYTQNPGMALGMDWASTPIISAIAITATIGIVIYIIRSLDNANFGYLLCMGLVLGGAFGNITDRLIMGYIGSYGGILEGHVIDFIHFTLRIDGYPVFPYIFNVADISISVSIIALLLFHQRILPYNESDEDEDAEAQNLDEKEYDSPFLNHGISGEPEQDPELHNEAGTATQLPDSEDDEVHLKSSSPAQDENDSDTNNPVDEDTLSEKTVKEEPHSSATNNDDSSGDEEKLEQ